MKVPTKNPSAQHQVPMPITPPADGKWTWDAFAPTSKAHCGGHWAIANLEKNPASHHAWIVWFSAHGLNDRKGLDSLKDLTVPCEWPSEFDVHWQPEYDERRWTPPVRASINPLERDRIAKGLAESAEKLSVAWEKKFNREYEPPSETAAARLQRLTEYSRKTPVAISPAALATLGLTKAPDDPA